jgi:hypothetical protein
MLVGLPALLHGSGEVAAQEFMRASQAVFTGPALPSSPGFVLTVPPMV